MTMMMMVVVMVVVMVMVMRSKYFPSGDHLNDSHNLCS